MKVGEGVKEVQEVGEVIFSGCRKGAVGDDDENMSFEECEGIMGKEVGGEVRGKGIEVYREGGEYGK
ncbi:hypothetical protein [Neisseria sicca]|uniref:hypothetical protein n=1 Tax=Neisseria sicca TaxID=490 RepID=UPI0034D95772